MASGARFFRTVCKSDASAGDGATEPQRKYRSSCSFFNYRECSCPHGSATIKISLISFRRLKLENPLQFSLLRASFLLVFSASLAVPPSLPPLSLVKTLLEVRIETERGIKGTRLRGAVSVFWSEAHRGIHGSCRFESLFGRPR